ncbi:MAG: hypothetical protein MUF59_02655 [Candidatus Krumholzibacteria bacterium]|nr:hypothetical protein [Candidatus Krumholzibacteria bacterium]
MGKVNGFGIYVLIPVFLFSSVFLIASCGDDKSTDPDTDATEVIELSETELDFATDVGDPDPANQVVSVTNTGAGTLSGLGATISYQAGQPTGWLSAILGGTIAPADLTIQATTGGGALASGIYNATVRVASSKANNSPQLIDIIFMLLTKYGKPIEYANGSNHSPNYLLGSKITVPAACTLTHLCVIGKTAGPQVKMALYTEVGGQPSQLVASTPATVLVDGELELAVTPTPISAGNYWFMAVYNTTANVGFLQTNDPNDQVKFFSFTFSSEIPATYPSHSTYTGQVFNYYIKAALD